MECEQRLFVEWIFVMVVLHSVSEICVKHMLQSTLIRLLLPMICRPCVAQVFKIFNRALWMVLASFRMMTRKRTTWRMVEVKTLYVRL